MDGYGSYTETADIVPIAWIYQSRLLNVAQNDVKG